VNTKILARIAAGCLGAALLAACAFAAFLIFPGQPGRANSLAFDGYIMLPRSRHFEALTILDYLTVSQGNLFATNVSNGDVYRIALHGANLPAALSVATFSLQPAAHGVTVDPVSRLAFVTRSEANTVDVFDQSAMRLVKRISVADDPDGIFYDSFDKLIYVANGDAGIVTLIDPTAKKVAATIDLDGKPEFAVQDPRTGRFYQNLKDTNSIAVVDVAARSVAQRWPLVGCEAPTGIAMDARDNRLFVGCSGNSVLAVFDLREHRVVKRIPVGGGPDSVAFDAGLNRIYVTGRSGILSVLQQDTSDGWRVLDSVHLHYGAHTLTVDPQSHRVFVGYASLFTAPRIAVFSAQKMQG